MGGVGYADCGSSVSLLLTRSDFKGTEPEVAPAAIARIKNESAKTMQFRQKTKCIGIEYFHKITAKLSPISISILQVKNIDNTCTNTPEVSTIVLVTIPKLRYKQPCISMHTGSNKMEAEYFLVK